MFPLETTLSERVCLHMHVCVCVCVCVFVFVFVCVRCPPTFEINAAVCILAWRSVNCVNCATQHVCHNNRVYMGHMWLPLRLCLPLPLPQLRQICATVVAVRLGHCVHVCGLKPLLRSFGCFVRPTASQSLMQLVQPLPLPLHTTPPPHQPSATAYSFPASLLPRIGHPFLWSYYL